MTRNAKSPTKQGKPRKQQVNMGIRVSPEFLDIVDRYVEQMNRGKDIALETRGSVVKRLLQTGLDVFRKDHPLDGNGAS